jgi:predicted helicase
MNKWRAIKADLCEDLTGVESYNDFLYIQKDLTKQQKGDYFELCAKAYFELMPEWKVLIKDYYLLEEVPEELLEELRMPSIDKGIDAILVWKNGMISAVQVKYRQNRKTIPFGKLATFPGLMYGTQAQGFHNGIMFTNCYDACSLLKNDKYRIINNDSLRKCGSEFWQQFRDVLEQKEVQYVRKTPREYQIMILNRAKDYYKVEKNGRLYIPCGTGKSLMGVWIAKELDCHTVFISVPSLYLLSGTFETWARDHITDDKNVEFLLIGSDVDRSNQYISEFELTTNIDDIQNKMRSYMKGGVDNLIVITTYQSSDIMIEAATNTNFVFDLGIFDEAHRTTGCEGREFTKLIGAKDIVKKRLFMTATERIYNGMGGNKSKVFSMDDHSVYGDVIYRYSTRMAIDGGQLVDYNIIASYITDNKYSDLLEENQIVNALSETYDINLVFSCLMIVDSMKQYGFRHMLVFSNTNKKALIVMEILDSLIESDDDMSDVYTRRLTGMSTMTRRKRVVSAFENSERSIISSAKIFGEGVDIPICDAVCFIDNKSSTVDIQQYVGRCLRLCTEKPNKKAYILIPFVMNDKEEFMDSDNPNFWKIRNILRAMGQTDDMIQDKFVLKQFGNIVKNNTEGVGHDEEEICAKDLKMDEMRNSILLKALDRLGDPVNEARKVLNDENNLRYSNGQNLMIEKSICLMYLQKLGKDTDLKKCKNWFRFCTSRKLYQKLKTEYYYTEPEIQEACDELGITTASSYKKRYFKDPKLPPLSWIDNGFCEDMKTGFSLSSTLKNNMWSEY